MNTEIFNTIVSSLAVAGTMTLIVFGRKIMALPKEMLIVKAATFRILRSIKSQGMAINVIAKCQKEGKCNGETEEAIEAVNQDQKRIVDFLDAAVFEPDKVRITEKDD